MARIFDGDFTIPQVAGPKEFALPFFSEGDIETQTFRQSYLQREDSWSAPAFMSVQIVNGRPFFLVEETAKTNVGAGIVQFAREYAMLPKPRTSPRQMSYTFRGIGTDQVYAQVTISSASIASGAHTFICGSNPSVSVGDRVLIRAIQTQYSAGIQTSFVTRRTAITGTSGTTVIVDPPVVVPGNSTLTFQFLQKVEDGRDPRTNAVTSFVDYSYYVPGVSAGINNVADIQAFEPELVIDATGKETLTYTDTTVPSRSTYLAHVAAGDLIVAEHTRIVRWKGDIFEASTPFVKAE